MLDAEGEVFPHCSRQLSWEGGGVVCLGLDLKNLGVTCLPRILYGLEEEALAGSIQAAWSELLGEGRVGLTPLPLSLEELGTMATVPWTLLNTDAMCHVIVSQLHVEELKMCTGVRWGECPRLPLALCSWQPYQQAFYI